MGKPRGDGGGVDGPVRLEGVQHLVRVRVQQLGRAVGGRSDEDALRGVELDVGDDLAVQAVLLQQLQGLGPGRARQHKGGRSGGPSTHLWVEDAQHSVLAADENVAVHRGVRDAAEALAVRHARLVRGHEGLVAHCGRKGRTEVTGRGRGERDAGPRTVLDALLRHLEQGQVGGPGGEGVDEEEGAGRVQVEDGAADGAGGAREAGREKQGE